LGKFLKEFSYILIPLSCEGTSLLKFRQKVDIEIDFSRQALLAKQILVGSKDFL
jgi:hypothetical protein